MFATACSDCCAPCMQVSERRVQVGPSAGPAGAECPRAEARSGPCDVLGRGHRQRHPARCVLVPAFNTGQQRLPLPANRCPKSASWTTFTGLYKKTSSLFGVDPYPWQNATLTHDIHKQAEEIAGLEAAFKGDAQVGSFQLGTAAPVSLPADRCPKSASWTTLGRALHCQSDCECRHQQQQTKQSSDIW